MPGPSLSHRLPSTRRWLGVSFVGGLTGRYVDFRTAQRAAFTMLAQRQGIDPPAGATERILATMSALPPHPEVDAALRRLLESPLRLVALTNSPRTSHAPPCHAQ